MVSQQVSVGLCATRPRSLTAEFSSTCPHLGEAASSKMTPVPEAASAQ